MSASGTDTKDPGVVHQSVRSRLESRTDDAFVEEERQGLMLAAKVRTVALLVILLWQVVDSTDTGMAYFYGLAEIAIFAVLGIVQYFSAKQRYRMNVLKYIFIRWCLSLKFLVDCRRQKSPFVDSH